MKVRGHHRRQRQVELWRQRSLLLDLEALRAYERAYVKIHVPPWNGLALRNSPLLPPAGRTKVAMLAGLLDIHDSWKDQLDRQSEPYYLRVWLFEPHVESSQVVCATGTSLNFYDNVFHRADSQPAARPNGNGAMHDRFGKFTWQRCIDEAVYDNTDVGTASDYTSPEEFEQAKVWFNRLLQRPHRIEKLTTKVEEIEEVYYFKRGYVWVGQR
jgi:hypothetical protein